METRLFRRKDIQMAVKAWNASVENRDMVYSRKDEATFAKIFMDSPYYTEDLMLVSEIDGKFAGFASGMIKKEYLQGENFDNTPGYITFVLVSPEYRRKGIGTALLSELCSRFSKLGKKSAAITYRNPMMLEWIVPCSPGASHNNAPGVAITSPAYGFFLSSGFIHQRTEDGLYLALAQYRMPEKACKKEARLSHEGITVCFYDRNRHWGFEELFDALHGEVWRKTIQDNEKREKPLPVLIAAQGDRIVGFAGPIDKELSGRGWFNGIATHPNFERRGIATVLFCRLMEEFTAIDAAYSTIFTDEGNPALLLYLDTGFVVGERFAVMERDI